MRILVIGGTQFMGRAIVARLVAAGHEVAVLHRQASHDLGAAVGNLQADRADIPAVARHLHDFMPDAVFDLAYDWQHGTPAEQVEAVARACGDHLTRYVFMSSVAAYGAGLDRREEDPLAPDEVPIPYIQHKAMAERALFAMHQASGFPVVTFRPPYVHGPGQPFYREAFFWDRLRDGRSIILPDDGSSLMHWAYVDDVADACLRALDAPEAVGEAFNIGHTAPVSQRELVEALARVAGIEPRLVPVPRADIMAAGGHLFMGNLYFGEYLDLPPMTEVVGKITRVLGIEPRDFEAALVQSYAWYLAQPRRPVDYSFEDRVLSGARP